MLQSCCITCPCVIFRLVEMENLMSLLWALPEKTTN